MSNHFVLALFLSSLSSFTLRKVNTFTYPHWSAHTRSPYMTNPSKPSISTLILYGCRSYLFLNHFIPYSIQSHMATHAPNHPRLCNHYLMDLSPFSWSTFSTIQQWCSKNHTINYPFQSYWDPLIIQHS